MQRPRRPRESEARGRAGGSGRSAPLGGMGEGEGGTLEEGLNGSEESVSLGEADMVCSGLGGRGKVKREGGRGDPVGVPPWAAWGKGRGERLRRA